jgi:hypothetical protein
MNRDGSPVKKLGIIDFQDGCHCVRLRVRVCVRLRSFGFVCVRLRVRVCVRLRSFGFVCVRSGLSLIYYFKD